MKHSNRRSMDRRRFIEVAAGAVATVLVAPGRALASSGGTPGSEFDPRTAGAAGTGFRHPDPRPDVDGSLVLAAEKVNEESAALFEGIRAIPHIADGLGCHCGCGAMPEMRSLLSCYEGIGMAQFCVICSGEGRMAIDLHAEGRTLDEIRSAIDRRFG